MDTPRLRFAPSPTGPLHLGGARTAIYNWAVARALGGRFLLRIEDTDTARNTEDALRIILEGLRWIGVDWDEGPEVGGTHGPYFQSERLALYARYAEVLLAAGHAYKCYATPEEVEAGRARLLAEGKKGMYDRRDRDLTAEQRARHEAEGRAPSLRYRMPLEGKFVLQDAIRGTVEVDVAELDDWVMVRPDGMPTYNFACVVDDSEMKITHVVRGEEHLMNAFKQAIMFEALDLELPRYAHVPLILGKDGKKLSKRDVSTNILDYRDKGYPPDAVFNYIALLGWSFSGDRDVFSREEMLARFRMEDIHAAGAKFDEEKLLAMCGHYIRQMGRADLVAAVRPWLVRDGAVPEAAFASHPGLIENAVACYQERIDRYGDLPGKLGWVLVDPELDDGAKKGLAKHADAPQWLRAYADLLEATPLPPSFPADRERCDRAVALPVPKDAVFPAADQLGFFAPPHIEAQMRAFAEERGIKFGHLVQPVRAALTGTDKGPGLFDVVFLLGKEACVRRLRRHATSARS
ncbi:MAG: glutamate--tRNA ligase [Planctomycetota bacterium]